MTDKIAHFIYLNLSVIVGAVVSSSVSWALIGKSVLTIITSVVSTVLVYFIKMWLDKRYKISNKSD